MLVSEEIGINPKGGDGPLSRRDFLNRLNPFKRGEVQPSPDSLGKNALGRFGRHDVSRRSFIKTFSAAMGYVGLGKVYYDLNKSIPPDILTDLGGKETVVDKDLAQYISQHGVLNVLGAIRNAGEANEDFVYEIEREAGPVENDPNVWNLSGRKTAVLKKEDISELRTVIETLIEYYIADKIDAFAKKKGLNTGNASIQDRVADILVKGANGETFLKFTDTCIMGPIEEEAFVRFLIGNSLIQNSKDGRIRWDAGVPVSLIFALLHNIKDVRGEIQFSMDRVPLHQFMFGMVWWYYMRKRGLSHSVISHIASNTITWLDFVDAASKNESGHRKKGIEPPDVVGRNRR